MKLRRNLAGLLVGLSCGALLTGWSAAAFGADEPVATAAASPEATQQPAAPEQVPAAEQPAAVEQPASAGSAAAGAEEETRAEPTPSLLPPAPAPSLQTLVDQRRDMIRKRREAMFDAYGWRDTYTPPMWSVYQDDMERYRDAMRALYRQQRDYSRQYHDNWMDAFCPWSRPRREWNDVRSYQNQMDRLDWQEGRDAQMYGQPWGYGAPMPW
jgi:hypothetical protein